MSVFDPNNRKIHTTVNCFLDNPPTISRFDVVKYPFFDKLTDKQLSFFWRPEEIDLTRDVKDFKSLSEFEQHIFTSNLKRQILLDSVQGRSPNLAFLPIVSLPELETWIATWAFSETVHSRSYTHIIRNVYPDPSKVFDEILDIQEIVDCAKDISKNYDDLITMNHDVIDSYRFHVNKELARIVHKEKLWLAIMSVNILEGVRFYVSFACSWAFAELKKMEGNAKIIKFIARDENVHLAGTQTLLKILVQEDKDFADIASRTKEISEKMFQQAADQEKAWAKYLFKDGSIIGLNEELLCQYVEWITNRRMSSIGLNPIFKGGSNPLPWTEKWISGSDVQVAPQEVEITAYLIGGVKQDINENTFKGIEL